MCITSVAATGFPGAAGSTHLNWEPGIMVSSPGSLSSVCFNLPTYSCTDVWISVVSWCVGQRNIC